mgnify:CR=1 FL=1
MKAKKILLASAVLAVFSLATIFFQISCSKPASAQSPTNCIGPQPKLSFKGNGVLYTCEGTLNSKIGWINFPYITKTNVATTYYLMAANFKSYHSYDFGDYYGAFPSVANKAVFMLAFENQRLNSAGAYNTSVEKVIELYNNGALVGSYESQPQSITLTITSVTNGAASGTFNGYVNPSSGTYPRLNITEGIFTDLPIFE